MMDEDLSVFFDDEGWAVPCSGGGHDFSAMSNMPSATETFEVMGVVTTDRTLMAPAADVLLAGLQPGGQVVVDGQAYGIKDQPFMYSGCRRIVRITLGGPIA